LNELNAIWNGIQEELAAEAEEEEESDSEDDDSDYDPENLDDQILAEQDAADSAEHEISHFGAESESDYDSGVDEDEWEEALDHIRSIAQMDGEELAEQLIDSLCGIEGELPSLEEVAEIWMEVQEALIEEEGAASDEEEEEEEAAYDPENAADQQLADLDEAEDREHVIEHFEQFLLNTPMVSSKRGGALSFNVYFDERELSQEAETSNLSKTVDSFRMMHSREPSRSELNRMKQFLSVPSELVDQDQEGSFVALPAVTSSGGSAWSVQFDQNGGSLDGAKQAFYSMHLQEPNTSELNQIRSFFSLEPIESDSAENEQSISIPSSTTKAVIEKDGATGYTLTFDDDEHDGEGDEGQAVVWFQRFNQRQPSDAEREHIRQFMNEDEEADNDKDEDEEVENDDEEDDDDMVNIE